MVEILSKFLFYILRIVNDTWFKDKLKVSICF